MKRFILAIIAAAFALSAIAQPFGSVQILTAAIATGPGERHTPRCNLRTFQATGTTSSGAGAATIVIQASDLVSPVLTTSVDWVTLGTITLTLATTKSGDGFVSQAMWRHTRANVTAISGTGASVDAYMGC